MALIAARLGAAAGGAATTLLAPTLQPFFTERMITQRDASPRTIAAYRDTFRLLLTFASERTGSSRCELDIDDLDAELIGAFLNHLETERGNSRPHPQREAGGDPLALQVRRAAPPRAPRHDRQGDGNPVQTPPTVRPHLPQQG